MLDVTVIWLDGQRETYPSVLSVNADRYWLHLTYDLETYSIPNSTIRVWKAEKP